MILNKNCPIPFSDYPEVTMAHGGGGKLMHDLISRMMYRVFSNPILDSQHDGAVLRTDGRRIAFSTDSHVITPLFFPGGNIGYLSVYGTVNDLAMCGAKPEWLSASFILEEGFPMKTLWKIVQSMGEAAERTGVSIVTGDTKVVDRGKGDGIYINTAGVGVIPDGVDISPFRVREGDAVIISGDIGRHGIAIMAIREGIDFQTIIQSDLAPLDGTVSELLEADLDIHCLRDLTRGGLASGLNEIASAGEVSINIKECLIPVRDDVLGACEILGFDPFYVANEGRFVVILPLENAEKAVDILQKHEDSRQATIIGHVTEPSYADVIMESSIGAERIVDMMSGEQLPRIC